MHLAPCELCPSFNASPVGRPSFNAVQSLCSVCSVDFCYVSSRQDAEPQGAARLVLHARTQHVP